MLREVGCEVNPQFRRSVSGFPGFMSGKHQTHLLQV